MVTHVFTPVLGKRIRVTELTAAGGIGSEATSLATDGFITINLSSEVETGTEIIVRKASGALCVNEKRPDSFKRFNVEIEFCGVNPSLLTLMTNAEPYMDAAGDLAGITVPEGEIEKQFALELWTGLSGYVSGGGEEEASGYFLLPFISAGTLGDITVNSENAVTFSLSGAYTKGGNAWGVGPYDVVKTEEGADSALPEAIDAFDHLLLLDTALAPPPVATEATPVPSTGG